MVTIAALLNLVFGLLGWYWLAGLAPTSKAHFRWQEPPSRGPRASHFPLKSPTEMFWLSREELLLIEYSNFDYDAAVYNIPRKKKTVLQTLNRKESHPLGRGGWSSRLSPNGIWLLWPESRMEIRRWVAVNLRTVQRREWEYDKASGRGEQFFDWLDNESWIELRTQNGTGYRVVRHLDPTKRTTEARLKGVLLGGWVIGVGPGTSLLVGERVVRSGSLDVALVKNLDSDNPSVERRRIEFPKDHWLLAVAINRSTGNVVWGHGRADEDGKTPPEFVLHTSDETWKPQKLATVPMRSGREGDTPEFLRWAPGNNRVSYWLNGELWICDF